MPQCCVETCLISNVNNENITFHPFPKDPTLKLKWLNAVNINNSNCIMYVCSKHFNMSDYDERNLLKWNAVPSLIQACKICLTCDIKLFDMNEKLSQLYEQISGCGFQDNRFPQKLCWECNHRLKSCCQLKDKAARSQALMLDLLNSTSYISTELIKTINRDNNNLTTQLANKYYESNHNDLHVHETSNNSTKTENTILEVHIETEAIKNEMDYDDIFLSDIKKYDSDSESVKIEIEKPKRQRRAIDEKRKKVKNELVPDELSKVVKKSSVTKKVVKKNTRARQANLVAVNKKEKITKKREKVDKSEKIDRRKKPVHEVVNSEIFDIKEMSVEEQEVDIEKRKETSNYKNSQYKCTVCYKGFLDEDAYKFHIAKHTEKAGAFVCNTCHIRYKTQHSLLDHARTTHMYKFTCKKCTFVTTRRYAAQLHEKYHNGTTYVCATCSEIFTKITTYMSHLRIKHPTDIVCQLCGHSFVSEKGLQLHRNFKHRFDDRAVPSDGPRCEKCNITFISDEALKKHLEVSSKHNEQSNLKPGTRRTKDPETKLKELQRKSEENGSMMTEKNGKIVKKGRPIMHPRDQAVSERKDSTGPVTCEQCGMQLRNLRLYAQHFRRAHPDKNRTKYPAMKKPCMCEQCGRIFQTTAHLKDHMWVHTGEKRFKCDRCEKSFTQKTNLVFHMRVHSASRPTYECPLCGKHFAFYNNRQRHMFIHTGLKPFKCDTCGKCFTTSGEQRAHIEHVHLKKPWPKRARARHMAQGDGDWQKCGMEHMED